MIINNRFYSIELSDADGRLISFKTEKQDFIKKSNITKALLEIKLLNENGEGLYLSSNTARECKIISNEDTYTVSFTDIYDNLSANVFLRCPKNEPFVYWSCEIKNSTGMIIEWIELPGNVFENTLKGQGGNSELFWPFGEGCIVDDVTIREKNDWLCYREWTYQSNGYTGVFPGPISMQFMAYYNELGGVYLATHDTAGNMKTFEYHSHEGGLCLEIRHYANGCDTDYKMEYEIVTGVFEGDWHDAAEIYRTWIETTDILPKKIKDRNDLPTWYDKSPVVAIYPIRGRKDNGDMTPNLYYPYENIFPYIDSYAKKMNVKIMALPMHWEGTAPWAPPYVWPPYGGEEQFKEFSRKLHEKNHLLGVYCSGIGWTEHSYLNEMDISDKYKDEYICRTPDNKTLHSLVIGPPIRDGFDMCPHSPDVAQIVKGELEALAEAGCDYTQYFDQNIGGNSCFCYAKHHGHPAAPGKWQVEDMKKIFASATENISSSKMLIGCELAASEPFIKHLGFNDLRYNIALFYGKAVPAYSYIYHEYINNFMGNQNTIQFVADLFEHPDSLLLRTAYSFTAGDMFAINLADEGKIFWGWDVDWDWEAPDQESICQLIKNLNAWRVGFAKKYLHVGRMVKSEKVKGIGSYSLKRRDAAYDNVFFEYPDVLTATYEAPDKSRGLIITNYLHDDKEIIFDSVRKVWTNPENEDEFVMTDRITVKPLSAVIAES